MSNNTARADSAIHRTGGSLLPYILEIGYKSFPMRVILIQPPVQDFYDTDVRLQPIGLCYIKAAAKKHLIVGLPQESLSSMIQTLAFNARLPVLLGAPPFYRTPDAPIARGLNLTKEDYLRARLTAMAVETGDFAREDIYTLFITTRIVNFLKGLELSSSVNLLDLLTRRHGENREHVGLELLKRLAETHRLYFWTKKGLIENKKFKTELFLRVLLETGEIGCQNGMHISVGKFARYAECRQRPAFLRHVAAQ